LLSSGGKIKKEGGGKERRGKNTIQGRKSFGIMGVELGRKKKEKKRREKKKKKKRETTDPEALYHPVYCIASHTICPIQSSMRRRKKKEKEERGKKHTNHAAKHSRPTGNQSVSPNPRITSR